MLAQAGDFLQPRDAEGVALRAAMRRLKASLQRKQHDVAGVSRVNQTIIHSARGTKHRLGIMFHGFDDSF